MPVAISMVAVVLTSGVLQSAHPAPGQLTFQKRVEALEAIERVYYSHITDASQPFDKAVPHPLIEAKVRDYLKQSAALERFWATPVTANALQHELERMARDTRMPERLLELYAALGNDPVLIAECLARPALVSRMARSFFLRDERIHAEARRDATLLRERLIGGAIDPAAGHQLRRLVTYARDKAPKSISEDIGAVGPILDQDEGFVIVVPLDQAGDQVRAATYTVPKLGWDDWWRGVRAQLDETAVVSVAAADASLPVPAAQAAGCDPGGSWDGRGLDDVPDPSGYAKSVWTGSHMIVWGGTYVPVRHRYDPATDTWSTISTIGAPAVISDNFAMWTGSVMLVWGGQPSEWGRYNPASDSWQPVSTIGAPSGGRRPVWSGTQMIVWGGFPTGSGARYDPATDVWSPMSTLNQPAGRNGHEAIWAGTEMFVWGGANMSMPFPTYFTSGGRYNPVTDTWTATSTANAPQGRSLPGMVWTGSRVVVWGGSRQTLGGTAAIGDGSRYDPQTDTWEAVSSSGAPSARSQSATVWTGSRMIVWGGLGNGSATSNTGGRYDPVEDTWASTSLTNAPTPRYGQTPVWTGSLLLVWGGFDGHGATASGGRYNPSSDTWTPIGLNGVPAARTHHTAVWTGTEMIVWGGSPYFLGAPLASGARFDPTLATWTSLSSVNAPRGREDHTAVWTGAEMIVWGGFSNDAAVPDPLYRQDGGRYNPIADTWTATRTNGAPLGRTGHSAVWTGSVMVVWGGFQGGIGDLNTGGRYDPAHNRWTDTSTSGAPSARASHAGVWTGTQMIVWGGFTPAGGATDGGRYDPVADTWSSMAPSSVSGNARHTVWTGSEMLAWEGSGQRYSPASNSWAPIAPAPALTGDGFSMAWAGHEMIAWGGRMGYPYVDTGMRYDSAADSWSSTTTSNAPWPRNLHSAVWNGSAMLVWGGQNVDSIDSGSAYIPPSTGDADADGFAGCDDCADNDPGVHAPPVEASNLQWGGTGTSIAWDADPGGSAAVYDVMSGDLGRVFLLDPGPADTCLANDLPALQISDASPVPPPGSGWFFLVRVRNACGQSRYETTTSGNDRSVTACP